MGGLGVTELLIVLAIVLVVFGAGKLPGIGDALGRSIKNFKRASGGNDELEVGKGDAKQLSGNAVEDADVVEKVKARKS